MLLPLIVLLPAAVLTQVPFSQSITVDGEQSRFVSAAVSSGPLSALGINPEFPFLACAEDDAFTACLHPSGEPDASLEFAFAETAPVSPGAMLRIRPLPDAQASAMWSGGGIDETVVAPQLVISAPPFVQLTWPVLAPGDSGPPEAQTIDASIPSYALWLDVLRHQPRPRRADEFLPNIKRIFTEEGVPAELAWLPEIESMFDPRAENAVGACGLFQLMPVTARALGLTLWPYDERKNPEKSARAAAALLRRLHGVFDSWPLALAAYNAGEGRVRRTLKASRATTFAEIADALPTETRRYVPKVLATLAVREGISPFSLPAPR